MTDIIDEIEQDRRKQIRNLKQYKDMSEEDFETAYQAILSRTLNNPYLEKRINEELKKFEEDYDISDLKINDKMTLRALIQAVISLEDYEQLEYKIQKNIMDEDASETTLSKLEKLGKIKNALRNDISRMQDDLKISRKIRKSDREESVLSAVSDMKERGKLFYTKKFARVFCPKCNLLLGSVWVMYPESANNKFWFWCKRCEDRVIITFPELVEKGMRNIDGIPDF